MAFAGSLTGVPSQLMAALLNPPGTPPGPAGGGAVAPTQLGAGWEIFVRSWVNYTTLQCQVPPSVWLSLQFVKMLDDIGSGTITLSQDSAWWNTTLGDGNPAASILNYECLWQVYQDGVCRFEFFGETITEQLIDPSEQRIVTVTGPGTIAALKWAMAAPQGYPNIVLKLDGLADDFDEVNLTGAGVIDTNIWNAISPSASVYITPVLGLYNYPNGSQYQLGTLYPSGTMSLEATAGTTYLGSTPWDATDTLISLQISPVGSNGAATDSNGNPLAYGTGLDGTELTQMYVQSLASASCYALIGLSATEFYCQLGSPGGAVTKVISTAAAYDPNNDAYWMITEQGGSGGGSGTFLFWTSPDGQNWTEQWSVVHSWNATNMAFYVTAKYDSSGQSAIIQNVNSNVTTPSYQGNIYLGESMMGIYDQLLGLAQARGTIPFVTTALTQAADSFGNPWSDTNNVQVTNGTDMYSLLQSFTSTVNADYVMQPGFNLQVGLQVSPGTGTSIGKDRVSQVIFREARHEMAKQRTRARNQIVNSAGAENQDGREITVNDPTSIAAWGQREGWFSTAAQVDPVSMAIAATAFVDENATEVLSWTLSITPNLPGYTVFENFDVGDWVGLEEAGASPTAVDPVRVTGIAVQVAQDGPEVHELTLVSYLQWLQEQFAYISNKLGGSFVNILGTTPVAPSKYGTGQVPTYFTPAASLSDLADVVGTGSTTNGAPLVYNAATGTWQPATAANPATGAALGLTIAGAAGAVVVGPAGVAVGASGPIAAPDGGGTTAAGPSTVITTQGDGAVTVIQANAPPPAIPDTPSAAGAYSAVVVVWDGLLAGAAPFPNFSYVQVHLSTSSGFSPSSATLQGTMHTAGVFTIPSLIGGTTYYAKLVAVNAASVASSPSTQASAAALVPPGGTSVTVAGTAPSSPALDALWYDTANGNALYEWNGSAWVLYAFGAGALAAGAAAANIGVAGVTASMIAAGAALTNIGSAAITSAYLATGAALGNLSSASIAASLLQAGAALGNIGAGGITSGYVATNAIAAGAIQANAVTAGKIAAGAINGMVIEGVYFIAGTGSGTQWENAVPSTPGFFMYYDPGATASTPTIASGTVFTNANAYPVKVVLTGGTVTNVSIDMATAGTGPGTYYVPASGTIQLTYTGSPAWTWTQVPQLLFSMTASPGADQWLNDWQGGATFVGLPGTSTNTLTVESTTGATLFGVDSSGNLSAASVNSATDVLVGGQSLANYMDDAPSGVVARGWTNGTSTTPWPAAGVTSTSPVAIMELDFTAQPGRDYMLQVLSSTVLYSTPPASTGQYIQRLYYTTDGTTPSTSSTELVGHSPAITAPILSTAVLNYPTPYMEYLIPIPTSAITYRFLLAAYSGGGAYEFKYSNNMEMRVTDLGVSTGQFTNAGVVLGTGTSGGGGGVQTYTEQILAANTYAYRSTGGLQNTNGNCYHGSPNVGGAYWNYSYIAWGSSPLGRNLATILAGYTVNWVDIRLNCLESYYDNGMRFGLHSSTTLGSSGYSSILNSGGWFIGEGAVSEFGLTSAQWTALMAASTYTVLAPDAGDDYALTWDGAFAGGGAPDSSTPVITVNYTG